MHLSHRSKDLLAAVIWPCSESTSINSNDAAGCCAVLTRTEPDNLRYRSSLLLSNHTNAHLATACRVMEPRKRCTKTPSSSQPLVDRGEIPPVQHRDSPNLQEQLRLAVTERLARHTRPAKCRLDSIIEADPSNWFALANRAAIYISCLNDDLARKDAAQALQINPSSQLAMLCLGILTTNRDKAISRFTQILAHNPQSDIAWAAIAHTYRYCDDIPEARKAAAIALALNPQNRVAGYIDAKLKQPFGGRAAEILDTCSESATLEGLLLEPIESQEPLVR